MPVNGPDNIRRYVVMRHQLSALMYQLMIIIIIDIAMLIDPDFFNQIVFSCYSIFKIKQKTALEGRKLNVNLQMLKEN